MAAYSAVLRGASRVFVVDRVPERLQAAEKIGCIAIDFTKGDAVDQILKKNDGMLDRAVDAVGYQATTAGSDKEQPNIVLENMIKATRPCGGLGIPGLYVPTDPGAPDEASGKGMLSLSFGKLFEKVSTTPICVSGACGCRTLTVASGSLSCYRVSSPPLRGSARS